MKRRGKLKLYHVSTLAAIKRLAEMSETEECDGVMLELFKVVPSIQERFFQKLAKNTDHIVTFKEIHIECGMRYDHEIDLLTRIGTRVTALSFIGTPPVPTQRITAMLALCPNLQVLQCEIPHFPISSLSVCQRVTALHLKGIWSKDFPFAEMDCSRLRVVGAEIIEPDAMPSFIEWMSRIPDQLETLRFGVVYIQQLHLAFLHSLLKTQRRLVNLYVDYNLFDPPTVTSFLKTVVTVVPASLRCLEIGRSQATPFTVKERHEFERQYIALKCARPFLVCDLFHSAYQKSKHIREGMRQVDAQVNSIMATRRKTLLALMLAYRRLRGKKEGTHALCAQDPNFMRAFFFPRVWGHMSSIPPHLIDPIEWFWDKLAAKKKRMKRKMADICHS